MNGAHIVCRAALLAATGLMPAHLRGYADPLILPGAWHGLLSRMFVVIVWPSLAWFAVFCARAAFRRSS